MKKTKLFAALGIGLVSLGLAVGATAGAAKAEPVHAEETRTIYFNAGGTGLWDQAGAWFCAWTWGSKTSSDSWVVFKDTDGDGYYEGEVDASKTGMKFLRMAPGATQPSWTNGDKGYWNQTGDIALSATYNCYTMTSWSGGKWSTYTPPTTPVIRDFYLSGTFNEWTTTDPDYKFTYDETADEYTLETTLTSGAAFKVNDGTWDWSIGNGAFTAVTSDVVLGSTNDGNVVLNTPGTHAYKFTLPGTVFGTKTGTIELNEVASDIVDNFVTTYMSMDTDVEGQCTELYPLAKAAYLGLTASQKELLATDAAYADAWLRFNNWAAAHGESVDALSLNITAVTMLPVALENNAYLVIVVCAIAASVIALCIVIKRKRATK